MVVINEKNNRIAASHLNCLRRLFLRISWISRRFEESKLTEARAGR